MRTVMLCVFLAFLACPFSAHSDTLALGHPAPPLLLHTLDGKAISTTELHGKVVIVTFWATWCTACREELPLLSAYAKEHAAEGLTVLGFSLDSLDELPNVKKTASTLDFPVGLLGSPWAGAYGRIWRMPVSFVIDRAGLLAYNGWNDHNPVWSSDKLDNIVSPMLQKAAQTTP
jgi:cytochrome c biogenesis protein CcmG/thiol:disulfide interchange protein DsbE